eukprot:8335696-Pyramimonas_sp.AAC.1
MAPPASRLGRAGRLQRGLRATGRGRAHGCRQRGHDPRARAQTSAFVSSTSVSCISRQESYNTNVW